MKTTQKNLRNLLSILLLMGLSAELHAQSGVKTIQSLLPDGERVFTTFSHRGEQYYGSHEDGNHRNQKLWRASGTLGVLVDTIALGGSGPLITDEPRINLSVFARTDQWIYYMKTDSGAIPQLFRTDGETYNRSPTLRMKRFSTPSPGMVCR